jgi:hypothetical protein
LGSLPSFISELVRAANEFGRIGDFEKRRLLDRAYRTVEEMRAEIKPSERRGSDYDSAIDFLTMSRSLESFTTDEIKEALLDAADMLRTLKIVLDAKEEVLRGE